MNSLMEEIKLFMVLDILERLNGFQKIILDQNNLEYFQNKDQS